MLSTPGGDRLDAALGGLDCMISVDNWINETTRHADVILPGLSALEQAHHDDLIWQFAVGSAAKYSAPIFPPPADRPHEWEILIRLAGVCLGQRAADVDVAAIDDGFFDVLAEVHELDGPALRDGYDEGGPERLLDFTLRTGPFGDRYGEVPDGINLDEGQSRAARYRSRSERARACRRCCRRRTARLCSHRRTSPPTFHGSRRGSSGRPKTSCSSAAVICVRTTRGCTTSRSW